MVNSNPETVSTDYDTSDRLYFEPLTLEDVLEIYQREKCWGAIVQFGGQTPLNLASALKTHGVNIIGTSPESIDTAEDRKLFAAILEKSGLKQPPNRTAMTEDEALVMAEEIGFPVLLRPSFVLGGRGMFIVYETSEFKQVVREAFEVSPNKPVLIDKFLEDAIELDVDCISDGETTLVGGMLEHIEFAGVHSGDAAMVMPPHTLEEGDAGPGAPGHLCLGARPQRGRPDEHPVRGQGRRTLRARGESAGLAHRSLCQQGDRGSPGQAGGQGHGREKPCKNLGFTREVTPRHWCVKEAVFPFVRFPGAAILLSPEMRSTGEVMGLDEDLGIAFAKTQMAAKPALPTEGNVFLSVKDADKSRAVDLGRRLEALGFSVFSTSGTARTLKENNVKVTTLHKLAEGRPNVVDMIKNGRDQPDHQYAIRHVSPSR